MNAAAVQLEIPAVAEAPVGPDRNFQFVSFSDVDCHNASAIVAYLRARAGDCARKGDHSGAIGLNEMAERLGRTRKKIQARLSRGGQ